MKKLKAEASEARFNNTRKVLQKATPVNFEIETSLQVQCSNCEIGQIFRKNYLQFGNLKFLNENNPTRFRSFSKATGRQKLSMKISFRRKVYRGYIVAQEFFSVKCIIPKQKRKAFTKWISRLSLDSKTIFVLIKQK